MGVIDGERRRGVKDINASFDISNHRGDVSGYCKYQERLSKYPRGILIKQARPKSKNIVSVPQEEREWVPFRRKIRDTVCSLALS